MSRILPYFTACVLSMAPALADTRERLIQLHYDLEVAVYCGLVSENVLSGFQSALKYETENNDLSQNDVELARMQVWKEAHLEWQNRGLGGFKNWCANDAMEGAMRLESYNTE